MDNDSKKITFFWFIENYSYVCHKNGEKLISPEFTADGLKGTVWNLQLYPRGRTKEFERNISLFLNRSKIDNGPENFPLKYELSIVSSNGSSLSSNVFEWTFLISKGYGGASFANISEIFLHRKVDYLSEDTLRLCCKLWIEEGSVQPTTIYARTRIGIEHLSFLHVNENFTALKSHERKTLHFRSASKKEIALSSSLYFSDHSCCDGKIMVEITPSSANEILAKCKLFLIDRSGKKIDCGESDNRFDAIRNDIQNLPLSLTRQVILNEKNDYLPDDKLTLLCECTFSTGVDIVWRSMARSGSCAIKTQNSNSNSTGVEYEKIETTLHEKPFLTSNQIINIDKNKDAYSEKLSDCPSLMDDLRGVLNLQFLTDVEIKTNTKSFPAHKILLCARSPVLKAAMSNEMREKNTNIIQVDDLEDETVQQLLLFLYTDKLEDLQWESAIKLYYAGDKYAIEKLKLLCSSFLVRNLSISNASELLLLADTHSDSSLKNVVEDFILRHEKEVFVSLEWEKLTETNPLLVSKTMLLKYNRKI